MESNKVSKQEISDEVHPVVSSHGREDEDKIFVEITPTLSAWTDDQEKTLAWTNDKVVWNENEKETYCPDRDNKELFSPPQTYTPIPEKPKVKRICRIRRRWFFVILLSVLTMMIVGLGAGLGTGLAKSRGANTPNATSAYNIGGSLDARYYSKAGAFNGSGIALNTQTIGTGGESDLILYYQHFEGTIRWMRLHQGEWSGGTASETVANDAKNNTPISATSYSTNISSEWHVFYIDKNNQIRERVNSSLTTVWADGALDNSALYAYDEDQVGMSACLYDSVFNDSDYADRTLTPEAALIGIHLRYASDNQTVKQYGRREGDADWTFQHQWNNINPHAGIGCNSFGLDTIDYVMLANQQNETEIWGKYISSVENDWENMTPEGLEKVHPSTSFGYNAFFYSQDAGSKLMHAYNISWAGFNNSIVQDFEIEGFPAIPGTHLGATMTSSSNDSVLDSPSVFYQAEGSDVSYLVRDPVTRIWRRTSIAIPES